MKVTYWTISAANPAPSIFFLLCGQLLVGEWKQIPGCVPFRGFPWLAAPTCNPTELRKLFSSLLVSAAYLSKIFPLVAWVPGQLLSLGLTTCWFCHLQLSVLGLFPVAHPNSLINISQLCFLHNSVCPSYNCSCDVVDHKSDGHLFPHLLYLDLALEHIFLFSLCFIQPTVDIPESWVPSWSLLLSFAFKSAVASNTVIGTNIGCTSPGY